MSKTLLFLYEPAQVDLIDTYLNEPGLTIIALDFWVEELLRGRNIPFESSERYAPSSVERDELFVRAQALAHGWYRIPEMSFFEHKDIRIGETLEVNFDDYLEYVLHYMHIITRVFDAHSTVTRVVIFFSTSTVSAHSAALSPFVLNAPVDVVRYVARMRGILCEAAGSVFPLDRIKPFPSQRILHRVLLTFYNCCMALMPRRRQKVFASEYWRDIDAVVGPMRDTELVLMDKGEMRHISWRQRFAHRVRLLHPLQNASRAHRLIAAQRQEMFRQKWQTARTNVEAMPEFKWLDVSLWPIVERAFDFMVNIYAERVVSDIESIGSIFQRERIQLVMVRASVSAQHHFFVLTQVAERLGIPSVELQHSGGVYDPRSPHSRLEAGHLAAYGSLTCALYEQVLGNAPDRLHVIGSPRFSQYVPALPSLETKRVDVLCKLGFDPARPVVLVVVPKEGMTLKLASWTPDSYDVGHVFEACAEAARVLPSAQFLFKFRFKGYWSQHERYLKRLFPQGNYAVSEADLFSMIAVSNVVVTGFSTTMYETMMAKKPLVLYPWKPDTYHNHIYGEIAPILYDQPSFIADLSTVLNDERARLARTQSGECFLREYCALDGRSVDRMTRLLAELLNRPT